MESYFLEWLNLLLRWAPGNLTGITDDERQIIDLWFRAGARGD